MEESTLLFLKCSLRIIYKQGVDCDTWRYASWHLLDSVKNKTGTYLV